MQALQPFSRLKRGDQIALDSQALKVIFFESGRQEIWQGTGKIEILDTESRGLGLSHPDVKVLPGFMVRTLPRRHQLAPHQEMEIPGCAVSKEAAR